METLVLNNKEYCPAMVEERAIAKPCLHHRKQVNLTPDYRFIVRQRDEGIIFGELVERSTSKKKYIYLLP